VPEYTQEKLLKSANSATLRDQTFDEMNEFFKKGIPMALYPQQVMVDATFQRKKMRN
jgi:hypothetical protein